MITKKVFFHSTNHPCTENAMNINMLKRWYSANEWHVTKEPRDADVIIVSTCGFSQSEETKEIQDIRNYITIKKKDAEVILTGCLAIISKKEVKKVFDGPNIQIQSMKDFDELFGFDKKIESFDNHFVSEDEYNTDPKIHHYFKMRKRFEKLGMKVPRLLLTVPSEKWFLVRVAMGCTGKCSYCAIKHAHGHIKSDSISTIIPQVKRGLSLGYKEISFSGEDQGGYGSDIGTNLAELLREVLKLSDDFVVSLRYIDPHWLLKLKEELFPIFKTGRIRSFCSPIQSGSNRILEKMNRIYKAEDVLATVSEINKMGKVQLISSNIIVGFPGETTQDFEDSIKVIENSKFGMHMIFKYEDRPGTKASTYEDKIPQGVIDERYNIIRKKVNYRHFKNSILGI